MISVTELCARRRIEKVDLQTPILIPSFSSKGFPDVGNLISTLSPHIIDTAMISSYDIFYNIIDDQIISPNLLFIDSGGYEARQDFDLSEVYGFKYDPQTWERDNHKEVLRGIDTLSALAIVSFDEVQDQYPLINQIKTAKSVFEEFPDAVSDFLIKPATGNYIDPKVITDKVSDLRNFDIVGFTEKELGPSLLDRLKNIMHIRRSLSKTGVDVPIHVVGCLDPLTVLLFYLCGADVFDGLSWLRFTYHDSLAVYRNNWTLLDGCYKLSDEQVRFWSYINNLEYLTGLRERMVRYVSSFDFRNLMVDQKRVQRVVNKVGISLKQ